MHLSFRFCLLGDFPGSSVSKESTCSAGDPGSISGSSRSTGEGIGCPLQYSWASLVTQLVKNPPVMQETWVQSLGWEDPLVKGMTTHSSIVSWTIPWTEEPGRLQSTGSQRVRHNWLSLSLFKLTDVKKTIDLHSIPKFGKYRLPHRRQLVPRKQIFFK